MLRRPALSKDCCLRWRWKVTAVRRASKSSAGGRTRCRPSGSKRWRFSKVPAPGSAVLLRFSLFMEQRLYAAVVRAHVSQLQFFRFINRRVQSFGADAHIDRGFVILGLLRHIPTFLNPFPFHACPPRPALQLL